MSARHADTADVYADFDNFDQPQRMGSLRCQTSRSGDLFSFDYDREWLRFASQRPGKSSWRRPSKREFFDGETLRKGDGAAVVRLPPIRFLRPSGV
jgi:hypothetical protein